LTSSSPFPGEDIDPFLRQLIGALPLYVWIILAGLCLVRVVVGPNRRRASILLVALVLVSAVYVEGEYHVRRFHDEAALPAPLCHAQEIFGRSAHLEGTYETQPLSVIDPEALQDVAAELPDATRGVEEEDRWIEARAAQIHSVTYPVFAIIGMLTLVGLWLVQPVRRG
jgi:hypothetical protein